MTLLPSFVWRLVPHHTYPVGPGTGVSTNEPSIIVGIVVGLLTLPSLTYYFQNRGVKVPDHPYWCIPTKTLSTRFGRFKDHRTYEEERRKSLLHESNPSSNWQEGTVNMSVQYKSMGPLGLTRRRGRPLQPNRNYILSLVWFNVIKWSLGATLARKTYHIKIIIYNEV